MSPPCQRQGALIHPSDVCAPCRGPRQSQNLSGAECMSIYHFSAQVISRSAGRSAVNAAAYRAGEKIRDERTGLLHSYTAKRGVLHSEIMAPAGAPGWVHDRGQLWNEVERTEKRKDAQLCREINIALLSELSVPDNLRLVREYVTSEFIDKGMIADLAIHAPGGKGDERNVHAHVMLTMRSINPDGFGSKVREWNDRKLLEHWREAWAHRANHALKEHGRSEHIDHRSLRDQGIFSRSPTQHLGPAVVAMRRKGQQPVVAAHEQQDQREHEAARAEVRNAWRDQAENRREIAGTEKERDAAISERRDLREQQLQSMTSRELRAEAARIRPASVFDLIDRDPRVVETTAIEEAATNAARAAAAAKVKAGREWENYARHHRVRAWLVERGRGWGECQRLRDSAVRAEATDAKAASAAKAAAAENRREINSAIDRIVAETAPARYEADRIDSLAVKRARQEQEAEREQARMAKEKEPEREREQARGRERDPVQEREQEQERDRDRDRGREWEMER